VKVVAPVRVVPDVVLMVNVNILVASPEPNSTQFESAGDVQDGNEELAPNGNPVTLRIALNDPELPIPLPLVTVTVYLKDVPAHCSKDSSASPPATSV
jgi:hypothetical protein